MTSNVHCFQMPKEHLDFLACSDSCNVKDLDWIPGLGRFPGKGNGYQL